MPLVICYELYDDSISGAQRGVLVIAFDYTLYPPNDALLLQKARMLVRKSKTHFKVSRYLYNSYCHREGYFFVLLLRGVHKLRECFRGRGEGVEPNITKSHVIFFYSLNNSVKFQEEN